MAHKKECELLRNPVSVKKCQMTFCNKRDCEHNENDECQIAKEYLRGQEERVKRGKCEHQGEIKRGICLDCGEEI